MICSKRSAPSLSELGASEFWGTGLLDLLFIEVQPNPRGRIRCVCCTFLLGLMISILMITETKLQQLGQEGWLEKEEDLFEKEEPFIYG